MALEPTEPTELDPWNPPELLEPLEPSVRMNGSRILTDGPVAQLGARLNGIQEVTGSIPVRSTILRSRELTRKRELRLGKPCEGCRAEAARPRRRAAQR